MRIARVIGNCIATIKHPWLVGAKLLLVDPISASGGPAGKPMLALDTVDAGLGDRVLVVDEGNSAAQVLGRDRGPVRTLIVGVVDAVEPEPSADDGGS